MNNPFDLIVPTKDETMVNEGLLKDFSKKIKKRVNDRRLIIIEGDYGSGKTLYLKRLHDRLKTKKDVMRVNEALINALEGKVAVKDKTIFIHNFDLIQGFNKQELFRLTEAMKRLITKGMIIIIACRKDTVKLLLNTNPLLRSKSNRLIIPRLSFQEARELVISRLNMTRKKKRDDLEPFNKRELRMIWHKANGNPRLILLLLRPLYEQRMSIKVSD